MSIHPSLNISDKDKKARSVLKRTERLRTMLEKGTWKEGDDVYRLPKIKTVRIKIKKEKAEKAETTATAEGAIPATGETKEQPAAKGPAAKAAPGKTAAAKGQEKK
ncbi:MAG: small basic protein [Candidatus Omnitrophica bacterium]|nr:small basic protein [Candidatus Omnitrophota bacterium]